MRDPIDPSTDYNPTCFCLRVTFASGRTAMLPCEPVDVDVTVGSHGDNPLDRLCVLVAGERVWVERRDIFDDAGELIRWHNGDPDDGR